MSPANLQSRNGLPADFTWPNGARLALSIVVNVEEGAEMNIRDGDPGPEPVDELSAAPRKPIRMHGSESNYQYGIKAAAPRIFRALDAHQLPVTVTAASLALERAPELARAIVQRGDEICCHGYRWVHQFRMDEAAEREFIRKGWESIEQTTGTRPQGWLSRYMHTDVTQRLLLEEGYSYHMDDYSDDLPFWDTVTMADGTQRPLLMLPYAMDSNDMKMWIAPSYTPRDWAQYAIDSFDWLQQEADLGPRMMSFGLHLRIVGRPGRMGAFQQFLDHVAGRGNVWVATRAQIAQAYRAAVPAPELTS